MIRGRLKIFKGQPWQVLNLVFEGEGLRAVRKGRLEKYLPETNLENLVVNLPAVARVVDKKLGRVEVRAGGHKFYLFKEG